MEKIKVLFICHGNICRSTMAQYVFQYMVDQNGLTGSFYIDSAATSREEIGNPPHHGTRRKLRQLGIPCGDHRARQGLITSSEWILGTSAILTGSSETGTRTGKCADFWILQTGRVRISQIRGTRAILM